MKFQHQISSLLVAIGLVASASSATASEDKKFAEPGFILASIKPIQLIAADINQGVIQSVALLPPGASPHAYALRPSQMKKVHAAAAMYWIDPMLESFFKKSFNQYADKSFALAALTEQMQGDHHGHESAAQHASHTKEDQHHDEHSADSHAKDQHHDEHSVDSHAEEEHHDEHSADSHTKEEHHDEHSADSHTKEEHHDEHSADSHAKEEHHDEHSQDAHQDEDSHQHNHGGKDLHIWLDPEKALQMAKIMQRNSTQLFPQHKDLLAANYQRFEQKINQLDIDLKQQLASLKNAGFLVFHDGYSGFVDHYQLNQLAALTINPSQRPGAKHLAELNDLITQDKPRCIFSEPQFSPASVKSLVGNYSINIGQLDPLATTITADNDRYAAFLQSFAQQFVNCLGK